jgi:hypothetical protein
MPLQITEENAREAAAAAQRLLNDPYLTEALDEQVMRHNDTALRGLTVEEREYARLRVRAVMDLRADLAAVVENWKSVADTLQRRRAHE